MPTYSYDEEHNPPAPVLRLTLRAIGEDEAVHLLALADTGADITLVPSAIAERHLDASGFILVAGVGTDAHRVVSYRAEVEIDGYREILEIAGWGTEVIVGRDLLNRWEAVFDGPGFELRF